MFNLPIKIDLSLIFLGLKSNFFIGLCFTLLANYGQAQPNSKEQLLRAIDSINQVQLDDVDSVYDDLKQWALEIQEDSIYIELTFRQIEKNGGGVILLTDRNFIGKFTFY